MASLINPPLLDKTGKEIVAELTGETVQPSASQYNAPISDATGKAILEAIKKGGGGSGGGANVLTLYMGTNGGDQWAYKNPEHTEGYQSCEEAETALANADVVILRVNENPANKFIPASTASVSQSVFVSFFTAGGTATMVYLYKPGPQ